MSFIAVSGLSGSCWVDRRLTTMSSFSCGDNLFIVFRSYDVPGVNFLCLLGFNAVVWTFWAELILFSLANLCVMWKFTCLNWCEFRMGPNFESANGALVSEAFKRTNCLNLSSLGYSVGIEI